MKWKIIFTALVVLTGIVIFISCRKELSCENCIDGNKPPIAKAGPHQVITLPTDSISLDGTASSDPDGTISNWLWTKVSGPASFYMVSTASTTTVVKNLIAGVYQFELIVTDNGGLSAKDTVQIIVNDPAQANRPPLANAGADQTITLPTNTVTLNGSGSTDPDNNITGYAWTKITGPSSFNITNANVVQKQVNNLLQGVYQFELKVTDAGGLFSKDTVQISVISTTTSFCDPTSRPLVYAQLIPFGNLSLARGGISAVPASNKLFFAGGFSASGFTSRVDIYDEIAQSWSTTELSIPRTFITAIASGDKVFFAGGYSAYGVRSSRVDIYNLTTQSWSTAELSQARNGIVAAAVGDKVLFAGGYLGNGITSNVDIYNLTTKTWSIANLSEARIEFTGTAAGNKIYFAGGYNGIDGSAASNKIDIYDAATNSWSVSTLSSPKAYMASFFKNGKIYWAGGSPSVDWANGSPPTCEVEVRDINTQVSSFTNLFQPNWGFGAFEKDNKIVYLLGRPYGTITPMKFDIYDTTTNTWSIGVLAQSIVGSIISLNNTIYVAEGGLNGALSKQVWKLEF